MHKKSNQLSLIVSIHILLVGCASIEYLPKEIESLDKSELCEITLFRDKSGYEHLQSPEIGLEIKIDDFSDPRSSTTKSFVLKSGDHTISGYFEQKLLTGDDEVTVSQLDMERDSSTSSQRPSSFILEVINYKNVYKNPTIHPGSIGWNDVVWYSIEFECSPDTVIFLGDLIFGADQFIQRASNN